MSESTSSAAASPWYKQPWPWFIIGLLTCSVVQGLVMLAFAIHNPPGLISDDYYDVGKGINQSLKREQLAEHLQLRASLNIDEQAGIATLTLQGQSQPKQLVLNLISPTQPEKDLRVVLQPQADGSYRGHMAHNAQGRRFVELLGEEDGQPWRLFEEENLVTGEPISLSY